MKSKKTLIVSSIALLLLGILIFLNQNKEVSPAQDLETKSEKLEPTSSGSQQFQESRELKSAVKPGETPRPTPIQAKAGLPMVFSEEEIRNLRSDARIELSSIYAFQKNYFSEFKRYTTDLKALGFAPSGQNVNFRSGFAKAFIPDRYQDSGSFREDPSRMDNGVFVGESQPGEEPFSLSAEAQKVNLSDFFKFCKKGCTADAQGFEWILVIPWGNERFDVWIINDLKELRQVQDGLKNE